MSNQFCSVLITQLLTIGTACEKSGAEPSSTPWLAANAGMPNEIAWRAAPTVPDSAAKGPMFWPKLMPETTTSGLNDNPWSFTAQITVSAGYPCTAVAGYPLAVVAFDVTNAPALVGVVFSPVPLSFVRGATTVTCVSGRVRRP